MGKREKLGYKFYLSNPSSEEKAFADFWNPLELDLDTRRTLYRVEFLGAIERIPEAQEKVMGRLRDEVLPHYDHTWPQEKKLAALRVLESLALADQCKEQLSPYGTALMGVLEECHLKADWLLNTAIWTITAWAKARAIGEEISPKWEWALFDLEEGDPYGLGLINFIRHRPPPLIIPSTHENEEDDEAFRARAKEAVEAWLMARKQRRESQGWAPTPSKSALKRHAEYTVRWQVLRTCVETLTKEKSGKAEV